MQDKEAASTYPLLMEFFNSESFLFSLKLGIVVYFCMQYGCV